jgi:PqqD family protein of HPr-rel-A system
LKSLDILASWRTTVEDPLPLREWDGDYVVYNALSGDTHVLDIVTGEVLRTIMARRACGSDLCRHIAHFLDVPNDAAIEQQVGGILTALDRLGLIEPATGC